MSLDDFLSATATRIPAVDEMLSLCDELKIGFRFVDGQPMMRAGANNQAEAMVISRLFRREPFRSMVIAEKLQAAPPESQVEYGKVGPEIPDGAVIVVADIAGRTDGSMKSEAYMWTWIGADRWYHVASFPVPTGWKNVGTKTLP